MIIICFHYSEAGVQFILFSDRRIEQSALQAVSTAASGRSVRLNTRSSSSIFSDAA